jgi:hypothetical protein
VLAVVDIPGLVVSTQWFWGVTPAVGDAVMPVRLVLLVSVAGFTVFFIFLTMQRRWQLGLEQQVAALTWRIAATSRHGDGEDGQAARY